jgi:hypothetical protein
MYSFSFVLMLKFKGFFYSPGPKRFRYIPRYYDEDKERLEKRVREIEQEVKGVDGERVRREMKFREAASRSWNRNEHSKQAMRKNVRLMVVLVALCVGFYYLYTKMDGFASLFANIN